MTKNNEKKVVPTRSRKTKEAAVAPMAVRRVESTPAASPAVTLEERARMIAEAAYYRAEARGFMPGDEIGDWLAAEREVDSRISPRH